MGTITLRAGDGRKLEAERISTPRPEEAVVLSTLGIQLPRQPRNNRRADWQLSLIEMGSVSIYGGCLMSAAAAKHADGYREIDASRRVGRDLERRGPRQAAFPHGRFEEYPTPPARLFVPAMRS